MTDVSTIKVLERELLRKRNEMFALEQAIAVLKGDQQNAVAISGLPKTREFEYLGITEAAKSIVKEVGPADTRKIADLMLDRGLRTRSKNFIATVYATLDNSKAFKRKNGLWELVEEKK